MWSRGGELFVEGKGYFTGVGEVGVVEIDGLIGGLVGIFAGEGFEEGPEVSVIVFV